MKCPVLLDIASGEDGKRHLISAEMDAVDDSDDTVEMNTFVLSRELSDLYCDWSGEGTARGFYYNPSRIVLFWTSALNLQRYCLPFNSSKASAILPTRVQHRHPLSISCTPSILDSLASSLSTVVSYRSSRIGTFEIAEFVLE